MPRQTATYAKQRKNTRNHEKFTANYKMPVMVKGIGVSLCQKLVELVNLFVFKKSL